MCSSPIRCARTSRGWRSRGSRSDVSCREFIAATSIHAGGAREGALPKFSPGLGPRNANVAEVGGRGGGRYNALRRGIIRSGTSAWRERHAYVHIDLHSRSLRNVEPPSVHQFV